MEYLFYNYTTSLLKTDILFRISISDEKYSISFKVHDMLQDNEYVDYLYSFTNGFEINRRLIIPLIRIHAPSLITESKKRSLENDDHICSDRTESIRSAVPTNNESSMSKRPSIYHERDCYLMPYSYKDIETMYTMLPRNRSRSLSHSILYPPAPCEQCKRYLNVPDLDGFHRNKKKHKDDDVDGNFLFQDVTNFKENDRLMDCDYLYSSSRTPRDVVLIEDENVSTNCCERFRKRSSSLSDLRALHGSSGNNF